MKGTLNEGDEVVIFSMPYTEERYEGKARLVKFKSRDDCAVDWHIESWEVQFLDDDPGVTWSRRIRVDHG